MSESEKRILRFLRSGACEMQDSVRESHVLLVGEQGSIAATRAEIDALRRKGLLRLVGQTVSLAQGSAAKPATGRKRLASDAQNRARVQMDNGETVVVNLSESPLARLYRMKNPDGSTFLSEGEFRAGERLRADFTRGAMMPSVTSRWGMEVHGTGCSHRGAGGFAEMSDIALASRQRVERALQAVDPELSGALVDVCCFLKGLETVERERQWPVRSAKILIKTALAMLERHYNPPARRAAGNTILHWGTEDYRPAIMPGQGQA